MSLVSGLRLSDNGGGLVDELHGRTHDVVTRNGREGTCDRGDTAKYMLIYQILHRRRLRPYRSIRRSSPNSNLRRLRLHRMSLRSRLIDFLTSPIAPAPFVHIILELTSQYVTKVLRGQKFELPA